MTGVWRYLTSEGASAASGLAVDEALMIGFGRQKTEPAPVLRLYTYADHAALCGRYQNIEAEIRLDACLRSGTGIGRRPTGGGAIVMGGGQLGVAVVTNAPVEMSPKAMLLHFAGGIVAGLSTLNIDASFGGKNDLKVDGRKIAGLGLYVDGNGALLFHASILADLDIRFMLDVLNIPAAKLGPDAGAAVAERVTTVSRETGSTYDGRRLRAVIANGFRDTLAVELADSELTGAEHSAATDLAANKYSSDEWLFQRSPHPDSTGTAVLKTPGGLIRAYVALSGDLIKSALFTGDFNELPDSLEKFEDALKWNRADDDQLRETARACVADGADLGVQPEALATLVSEAAAQARTRELAAPERDGSCYFPDHDETTERQRA